MLSGRKIIYDFAVLVLYVDGMYDVNAVEMWQVYTVIIHGFNLLHTYSHAFRSMQHSK
jgi:ABC-type transporter MlaC component